MIDFSMLFRRHRGEIIRVLRRRGFSQDAAADIVQDAFVRVLALSATKADGMHVADNPKGYLHRVARNLSIDIGRRERNSPFSSVPVDALHDVGDQAVSQEKVLLDRQKLAVVAAALERLPERTRRAFEMHRLGDMTIAEVAHELGLSTSRAGALIKDAYHHIRASLNEERG